MLAPSKEYTLALAVRAALADGLPDALTDYLEEGVTDLAQQDDRLTADAKANAAVILVSVQPPVADAPTPVGLPNHGNMRAQIAIFIAARNQYGGMDGMPPHESACALMDACIEALHYRFLNRTMDDARPCGAITSVADLAFDEDELQNCSGRRLILEIPFSY